MTKPQLVTTYLALRGELAAAFATEPWKSCRLGHIERVSRELATMENALEAEGIDDEFFGALVSGRWGMPLDVGKSTANFTPHLCHFQMEDYVR